MFFYKINVIFFTIFFLTFLQLNITKLEKIICFRLYAELLFQSFYGAFRNIR